MSKEVFMRRAIGLALQGYNTVAPNPKVGAVLVYEDRIIGEGYHAKYGEAHAEVVCLQSVAPENRHLIPYSTLYVTLEPCSHFGKTAPCADYIISQGIPKVVIGNTDPNPQIAGNGIRKLLENGTIVETNCIADECGWMNRQFLYAMTHQKPYIIIKWAEDLNGNMGKPNKRIMISSPSTNHFTMKWRSEVQAILVGYRTVLSDNPYLNNRSGLGTAIKKIIIDPNLLIQTDFKLFKDHEEVIVFNGIKNRQENNITYVKIKEDINQQLDIDEMMSYLFTHGIYSIIVEGGSFTSQNFISTSHFNEIRTIKSPLVSDATIKAPHIPSDARLVITTRLPEDTIFTYLKS